MIESRVFQEFASTELGLNGSLAYPDPKEWTSRSIRFFLE